MPQRSTHAIDLNCDLGEGGPDELLVPLVGRVNIAAGGHAGDDASMRAAIGLAMRCGAAIGAHPSYPDRDGFGRRELNLPAGAIGDAAAGQLERFAAIARELGATLAHVKPHGALYHRAGHDGDVARAVVTAVRAIDPSLAIVGQPRTALARECASRGTPFLGEFFADRRYAPDGSLTPRSQPDAVIEDPAAALAQVVTMLREGVVVAADGTRVSVGDVDTVCVHGDGATAAALLAHLREGLTRAGVPLRWAKPA